MKKTKGQIEAEISNAIIKFEKEYMGRGPLEIKSYLIEDMILARLSGVLTKAECQLVQSNDPDTGRELIKKMRHTLLENGRPLLEAVIKDITGKTIRSMHTDISTTTGERIIIFVLESPPK